PATRSHVPCPLQLGLLPSFSIRRARPSTLFPYTTLFRSLGRGEDVQSRSVSGISPSLDIELFPESAKVLRLVKELNIEAGRDARSEEHTSELQSRGHLVCRPLPEKKRKPLTTTLTPTSDH